MLVCIPAAVDACHRLGQEARRQIQLARHLTGDQLVKLNLVRRDDGFGVAVVHFELRRRDFGMILLVGEAHRPLNFRRLVDERAQLIAGQRMVVAARRHELKLARFDVILLGVARRETRSLRFRSTG